MSKPKTYLIPAGKHEARNRVPGIFIGRSLTFLVTFNETAVYETSDPENQMDINKLYGFSAGWNHHKNSARFGWNCIEGKVFLYKYVYHNGQRISELLCQAVIGQTYKCRIEVCRDYYAFAVFDTFHDVSLVRRIAQRKPGKRKVWGFKLFPFFGGNEPAPHDVTIQIQKI